MNGFWHRLRSFANKRWGLNALVFVLCALALHVWNHPRNLEIAITATLPQGANSKLYHAQIKQQFSENQSIERLNQQSGPFTHRFTVRSLGGAGQLRWDPMGQQGRLSIQRLEVQNQAHQWSIQGAEIRQHLHSSHQIEWLGSDPSGAWLVSTGEDPYLVWHLPTDLKRIGNLTWAQHGLSTVLLAGLLTGLLVLVRFWLNTQTVLKGGPWLARRAIPVLGLALLSVSVGHLTLKHNWWTWGLVQQANERDGLRQALPPLIQDAKVLLQRIDPQIPVALSSSWRSNTFWCYAAEEYLYPRRLVEQARFQLSPKGSVADVKCTPLHEHGVAVLLECHD